MRMKRLAGILMVASFLASTLRAKCKDGLRPSAAAEGAPLQFGI
jgi:hypothetical protein